MNEVLEKKRLQRAAAALDADVERNTWPELDPLPEAAETTPEAFPLHALGKIMGDAAKAIAGDVQAPDALVAGSVLAAASLAAQPLANVVLPHGQRCPLSLFVVSSGQSGDRKSAADAVAGFEIEEARRRDAREYAQKLKDYEDAKAAKGKGDPEPEVPTPKTLTTSNATVEGLSRLLKAQSSVGLFSAEGGEMLGGHSMREDRRSAGLAFFLKAWSGETIDSLRGGEGLTTLLGRRVALHIMVQPILLSGLLADPLAQGQGLLARCLISQPATLAGTRTYKAVDPNANPATRRFHDHVRDLLDQLPNTWPEGDGYELKPRDLQLTADAAALWIAFYNAVEHQQAGGGELAEARPFASKAAEHAARIAGVMTLLEDPDARTIGAKAIEGAIVVAGFYINEHLRLTGASKDARHIGELTALWDWLKERSNVSNKDVLQRTPRPIRKLKAEGIKRLLAELKARGYIRENGESWEVRRVQA